ncbi:hypothetical protein EIN_181510 [Entamoeba invadens IP1]|uniref:hypothetical protein n=1 Tax=Entamoeba invadens IP1 TaxID=370355 RepID=UPI0002C3D84C|nr:hypothetical protein EIN_181510 [Entamoeba invadens IP1]ELP93984.1 hypothetical protein EIN_181510 [Entamoeba invadens IP1]|eukprot:XP_004260755.1 hypothetical protein EIN_181510 [Entamoeba invadens IP1]
MEADTKNTSKQRIRYKDWLCTFPGCTEPPKTKYNMISHIWDSHLKFIYPEYHKSAFKNLENKEIPRELCEQYLLFSQDEINMRKRKLPVSIQQIVNTQLDKKQREFNYLVEEQEMQFHLSSETQQAHSPPSETFACDPSSLDLPPLTQSTSPPTIKYLPNDDFITVEQISPTLKQLHVLGSVFAENGFFQLSDARTKTKIAPIGNALHRLLNVIGKIYTYDNATTESYGFIAQELKEVFPELVKTDENGLLSIDPVSLIPFVVESVKELDKEVRGMNVDYDQSVQIMEECKNVLKESNSFREEYDISLGPKCFTLPSAIIVTILSVVMSVMYITLPFLWIYMMILSGGLWYSAMRKGNKKASVKMGFSILITLGIVCGAFSFLVGSSIRVVGIYLVLVLGMWLWGQFFCQWKNVFYLFLGISVVGVCVIGALSAFQPGFECNAQVFGDMVVVNKTPWNCLDPEIGFVFEDEQVVWVGMKGETLLKPINKQNKTVGVRLKCSEFVGFDCGNVFY